jgi:CopG family transcriptional regulator/antitoxin EndoAI
MSTANISFNPDLLRQIDEVAQEESRSRSERIREAARTYIERKRRRAQIF